MAQSSVMKFTRVNCKINYLTENAVLVDTEKRKNIWIPRSTLSGQSDDDVEDNFLEEIELSIHDWFVKKEGLI